MNREIKFRAWDGKKMFNCGIRDDGVCADFYCSDEAYIYEKYPIMQYTGLKDKDGKEIYEGDIIKHRDLSKLPIAVMKYGIQVTLEKSQPLEVMYEHCGFYPFNGWIDDANKELEWEVIGNIYENPKLLK